MGAPTAMRAALDALRASAATAQPERSVGKNAKASLLYDAKSAADIDRETLHAIGASGFEELCRRDGRFEAHARGLFGRAVAEGKHRELEDAKESAATSARIGGYLKLLSGYFTEKAASKTLEYLIRRFKIHVYDVDAFIACAMPWHSTPEFVKACQVCQLENSKHFKWLAGVKETGAAPPRDALAVRCSKDKAFFTFCAESAAEMATAKGNVGSTSAFYAVLLTETLGVMKDVDSTLTTRLLPYLEAGLASTANSEQFAGALMVATQLAARTQMAGPLVEALLEGIAKGTRAPLHAQALQALLALCQTQRVKSLPERAFKHLVKIPELEELIADLLHAYRADAFSIPLMRSLAEFVDVHANYERILRAVIEKAPLHGKHFIAAVPILLQTAKKSDSAAETVRSILVLADQYHPVAMSEGVDFVFRGAPQKKNKDASAEKPKKDKMIASEEDAAFLRSALLGSASGPMAGHATSIAAALDHPNASLRESAIAQLAEIEEGAEDGADVPSSLKRGSALGSAMLRRVSDDDARVAAAAMDLKSLRRMVNNDGVLFGAVKSRLHAATVALAAGSAHSDSERRVAKKALRLVLGILSKDEDGTAQSALASRAAALAYEYILFSASSAQRNVVKAALNAARGCPHPSLDGVRSEALREIVDGAKSNMDGKEREAFEQSCNETVLSALADSLLEGGKAWVNTNGEDGRELWIREMYRDMGSIGRATILMVCKAALDKTTSGKTTAPVAAVRRASWSIVQEHWSEGVGASSKVDYDDVYESGSSLPVAGAVYKLASNDKAAKKYVPSCSQALLSSILAGLSKKSAQEASDILPACFQMLATTDASSSDSLDVAIGERLRDVLDASDRCYGDAGSSAFLASRFAADPATTDVRVQVTALELCATCSKTPSIASVIVAAASSASPVRDAAAALLATYARSKSLGAIAKAIVSDASEISLKGAVAMCKSIERGLSTSKDSGGELTSFLEPIQEMITEEMPTLDAYGARCLIASTRGLGSSAVKAEVLIPALEWAMNTMKAGSVAKAALAVEIIQVFDVEYAKTLGKNGGDAWALLLRCMTLPSPSAVRAAAFGVITPELVHVLKTDAKSQLFKVLFTAVNADPEDISRRQAQVAVDSLVIDANDVVKTLRAAMQQTPAATPAKKKGKSAAAKPAAESFTTSKEAVQAAVTALEILSWKLEKTDNVEVLVEPCQEFLTALMNTTAARAKNANDDDDDDSDYEDSDDEESGVAAGGYIEALVLRTMESLAASGVGGDSWDVKLIIRAVREVEEGAARSAALACLAQIAHVAPDAVLENVFEVSSVLSDRAAASDDVLSQRALENALVAVVPVWLSSGESLTNVVSRLIDSLPSAPPRRRAPICAALVRAAPEGEALPAIILNLLRRCKNLEASARDIRAQTKAIVDASDVPVDDDDKWVMELLGALLVRETPFAAVDALVTALKASAEEGGRLVRACAEASARHLSSTQFTRAQRRVSDDDGKSALQDGYASLAESAIVLLQSVGVKDDTPGKSPSSKSANKAEASGQSLLSALDGLLSSGPFLRALTPLLGHKEGRVRRKALTLVTERLQNASAESDAGDDAETEAGVALIRELSALIQSKSATTAQAALMALEASALRFATAQSATKPLLSVVPAIVAQLGSASSTLCASAALSLATLAKVLGVRMVSVVNTAMPALLTATTTNAEKLHTGDDGESALVVHSCLAAIRTFVANMAGFVSPFLSELLKVSLHPAVVPSIEDDEQGDGKGGMRAVHDLALAMREELPVLIELRLLIRPLVESWETCLAYDGANGAESCAALLEIIAAAGDSENATNAHRQQLFSLVLRALDIRRNAPVGAPEAALDAVEGKAVVACVALALKCTESEFLPFFLQCVEWARARSGEADVTRTRLAALFRLAASLADELRAVFVPFFRHLLDLAAAALDVNADPTSGKKKRKSVNADALAMDDIWRMRKWTLAALRRCFQFDNVGFMDSNRYNMLYPLVVEQLTAAPKMDVENDKYDQLTAEGTFGYEVVSACSSLLVAAPDDAHWKPLHRAILMAGRDKKIQTRFFCVRTIEQVVDKLQEEYLTLLPEAIPFLAELTEDMDEYIELATRKLTKRLSELSGEDLKTLMTDGFNPQPKKSEDDDDDDDDSD